MLWVYRVRLADGQEAVIEARHRLSASALRALRLMGSGCLPGRMDVIRRPVGWGAVELAREARAGRGAAVRERV